MAKSKGNFITLQSLIDEGINPIAYRYFCLNAHYRQQLNFSVEAVKAAESSLKRFREFILKLEEPEYIFEDSNVDEELIRLIEKAKVDFDEAVSDDLNTPKALGIVFDFMKEANKFIDSGKIAKKNAEDLLDTMYDFDKVLGIMDFEKDEIPEEILELARARETARNSKDWKKSDMLRDEILKKGYLIDDTSTGFRVKKK